MAPVVVKENIERIEKSINQIKEQNEEFKKTIEFNRDELLRLEGCLLVFKGFEDAGITVIKKEEHEHKDEHEREHKEEHEREHKEEHEHEHKEERTSCENNNNGDPVNLTEMYKKYSLM